MASSVDRQALTGLARSLVDLFDRAAHDAPASDRRHGRAEAGPPPEVPDLPNPLRAVSELEVEVDDFLSGEPHLRAESASRIRGLAILLTDAGRVEPVADAVIRLAMVPTEEAVQEEAEAVARALLVPPVATRLAERLGAVRDASRRSVLSRVLGSLGAPMARAAGEALARTESRAARRGLTDLMVSLGRDAEEILAGMVTDPRWYVVRNAVLVLGETGGRWAVPHLSGALEHGDPRVRREGLLALARSGHYEVGGRMVALLDDPDERVREAAALATGVLRQREAVQPLLERLRAGDTDSVMVAALRALGRIGDPRATEELERQATGSVLSRPSPEVRIAAYRALSALGNERARAAVRAGLEDRAEEVREAVQESIRRRQTLTEE